MRRPRGHQIVSFVCFLDISVLSSFYLGARSNQRALFLESHFSFHIFESPNWAVH